MLSLHYIKFFFKLTCFLLLWHYFSRNDWREQWSSYSRRDLTFGGIHPDSTHLSHSVPSLSHCFNGRVQPPTYTNACHHGTQGSANSEFNSHHTRSSQKTYDGICTAPPDHVQSSQSFLSSIALSSPCPAAWQGNLLSYLVPLLERTEVIDTTLPFQSVHLVEHI